MMSADHELDMKRDEKIAEEYLKSSGHKRVDHWPDGDIPPDFAVDSNIGVEVRRLNQQYSDNDKSKGLEEDRIPLYRAIKGILREFDEKDPVDSFLVSYNIKRPIGKLRTIKKELREALKSFPNAIPSTNYPEKSISGLNIRIIQAHQHSRERFRIAVTSDSDAGGLVTHIYASNIQYCMDEKASKISRYRDNYRFWWLVLVDYLISLSISISDDIISEVIQNVSKPAVFNRIIIINPFTSRKIFEI